MLVDSALGRVINEMENSSFSMRKRETKCISIPQRPDCTGLASGVSSLFSNQKRSQKQGQWLEEEEARAGVLMEALLHTAQPSEEDSTSHGKEGLYPSMKFSLMIGLDVLITQMG